uniref:CSON015162 protein n=1 Tax=Culicoides sonorensis TaxID=179676 RepID=A0A336MCQ2_CULSO
MVKTRKSPTSNNTGRKRKINAADYLASLKNDFQLKSEESKYNNKNSSESNTDADKSPNHTISIGSSSCNDTEDHQFKQSINKLNINQEDNLLLLSTSTSSTAGTTPAFDNQTNHNSSVTDSDNSSMPFSGATGTTSVITLGRSAYQDNFFSSNLEDNHHHPSVIQSTTMVASRMSPITPPSSLKYSNMDLPADIYGSHPAVAATPPYHDTIGDDSPLHYSTLNNAIQPNYSQNMLNNNSYSMTNNNTFYSNNYSYDLPLNLRQKPETISPHNTIIKHEQIIDNRILTLDHHPETLHISSHESSAVAMRGNSNNNTGSNNHFSANEGFQDHNDNQLVDHNVLTEDHETESHNYLTLTSPAEILAHQNLKESPYHNNNNNNNNNLSATGHHNHSSSGDSRSPNAYDGYDSGIHNSLTQLTPVGRIYSPTSTDHPSVIQSCYFDPMSPAR